MSIKARLQREAHKAEFKRKGGELIEITPESIARRTGGL